MIPKQTKEPEQPALQAILPDYYQVQRTMFVHTLQIVPVQHMEMMFHLLQIR